MALVCLISHGVTMEQAMQLLASQFSIIYEHPEMGRVKMAVIPK